MITTVYAKEDDMTFIMKETTHKDTVTVECVGWYYGSPNEETTKKYIGNLKAEFAADGYDTLK